MEIMVNAQKTDYSASIDLEACPSVITLSLTLMMIENADSLHYFAVLK